jgi:hypothetical protein
MTTTLTRTRFTVVMGAAIIGAAAPALFLGAGTAQAVPELADRGGAVILDYLPAPRDCGSCGTFRPQADPSVYPDTRLSPAPGLNPPPGLRVGLGGPDTLPSAGAFNPQPDPPSTPAGP